MVQLFLSEPAWSDDGDDESIGQRISLLHDMESAIWSLMSSGGGRSEARLWLCKTLSGISSVSPRHQRELFVKLLRSKPLKRGLAAQVLQMIFERLPHKAGPLLAKRSHVLENFFRGNPRRILQWFSNFSGSGDMGHRKGAKALSQFAFVNRDICWDELVWKGKHGQSPAMVATKPHYFLDLDVQRTVENFLEYVPEFWTSNEFADSLKNGEILSIDTKFFVDLFFDLIYKEELKEAWEVINEFLMEESFSSLCHHLLIILEEQDLDVFLEWIPNYLHSGFESMNFCNSSRWLETVLSMSSGYGSMDHLLLLNAVVSQGRQLLRLVREEENQEEKVKIKAIVSQIHTLSSHANILAPILKECFKKKNIESIKWLGLQTWALHYRLSEECQTPESWEALFVSNGISFRKSDKYAVLHRDAFLEESGTDLNERASVRVKHKKKEKHRKRRRRNLDYDDNEMVDFDLPNNR
ncbi:unnamed protein product [Ilex paraguariensis]